jgi:hypothetical protein
VGSLCLSPSSKVNTGNIYLTLLRLMPPGVFSAQLSLLLPVQITPATVDWQQAILGYEQGMVFTEALPFRLNISQVVGVILGYLLPIVSEVALNVILPLQLKVRLLRLLKQGGVDAILLNLSRSV